MSFIKRFRKDGNAKVLEKAFFGAGLKRIRFTRIPKFINFVRRNTQKK